MPSTQLHKAIRQLHPLCWRPLGLLLLFILSLSAFVVLADSEVQAKERDGFSPQNSQQPPPVKTVGAVEETAATGRSPTESTPIKPLPSSEKTQTPQPKHTLTPPAAPAPPTFPPPATTPPPEPAPQPEPAPHYEPAIPADATPQPKHAPTPQPKPGLKEPTLHYEPGMLVDFDPPDEISADPALIVYYHNSSAPKTAGLVSETSLAPPRTGGTEETSVQAKVTPPSVGQGGASATAAPELLPATLKENNPAENSSLHVPPVQPPATPANVWPTPVSASSPTNVAPANVAPAMQQPSLTATYQKVPATVPQSEPSYPRSADAMTLRKASSSKGVVDSYVAGTAAPLKVLAVTNPRAPLTGVSSAERPPADDNTQSPSKGSTTSVVPSSPLTSPESSHFYQQFGGASVGASVSSGVGFAPLLLGLLISVMLLCRGDGRSWQLSWYLPKPTSVLLLPLERPG